MEDFNKAIRLDPSYAKAYQARGSVYWVLGNKERAQKDYEKAKSLGYRAQ